MFEPTLDFRYAFDRESQEMYLVNTRANASEKERYIPADGLAAKDSYALISVLPHAGFNGHIVLIGGLSPEGTAAAWQFVSDPKRWQVAMQRCSLTEGLARESVQILLHLGVIVHAPNAVEVVTCHAHSNGR